MLDEHSNYTRAMTMKINYVDLDHQWIGNDTGAVMIQRVAEPTRGIHKRSNITFIPWLFDQHNKYHSLLQPTLYYMMQTKKLEDISLMTTRFKRSKSTHGVWYVYREALWTIKPYVQASITFKLEHLTFNLFSRFLSTVKKKPKKGYTRARNRWRTGCQS